MDLSNKERMKYKNPLLKDINFYKGISVGLISYMIIKSVLAIITLIVIYAFGR